MSRATLLFARVILGAAIAFCATAQMSQAQRGGGGGGRGGGGGVRGAAGVRAGGIPGGGIHAGDFHDGVILSSFGPYGFGREFGPEGFRQVPFGFNRNRFNRNEGGWGWSSLYPYGYDDWGYYPTFYVPDYSYWGPYPQAPVGPFTRPVYQAYYPPTFAGDAPSTIQVLVPPTAEVWFDGQKTRQMGGARYLEMPPMPAGQSSNCEIRVAWMANGKSVTETRAIQVQGGSQRIVNFMVGSGEATKAGD